MKLFNRVDDREKVDFANNLAVMLKSGLTVTEALTTLSEQTITKTFRLVLERIRDQVQAGMPLSKAFETEREVFGPIFISMLKVGESSGALDESLEYLAQWVERDHVLKSEVKSATMYPRFVLGATFAMGTGLALYILPKLIPLFSQLRVELPFATRFLLASINFLQDYWYVVIAIVVALYFAFNAINKIKAVRRVLHRLYMKLPIVGDLITDYQLALITRLFETLLKSGITVRETIAITADAVENINYQESLLAINERIKGGTPLSQAMSDYPGLYPKNILSIIEKKKKSGNMDESLGYLADYYIKEVQAKTKQLPVILEPALLLVIGAVVGFVAYAIIMPIYSLSSGVIK